MTSSWTYGKENNNQSMFPNSAGKLAQAQCGGSACESGGYTRTYYYDKYGRQNELNILLGALNFFTTTSYESGSSRIAQVQYFSGYVVKYVYDSGSGYPNAGYLRQIVAPNSGNLVLWQAIERDQDLHLVQSENGGSLVQQTAVYDPLMGRLTHTCASNDSQLPNCDGNIANFQYDWNNVGQLADRIDYLAGTGGLTEYFCYDGLNRLKDIGGYGSTNTCTNGSHTGVSYDEIGNIAQKTDAGVYTTPPSGPNAVLPHAVSSITVCSGCTVDGISGGNAINFYYDGNGNLNCETTASQCDTSAVNNLTWTSFNRPSSIVHGGTTTLSYSYDPEHNRIEMNAPGALTKYLSDPASGVMTEHMGPTTAPYADRDYIMADGHMVAIIVTQNSSTTASIYYPILDHLGSVAVIVDGNATLPNGNANPNYGDAIDRYSYDAWGEARDPGQWTPRTCTDGPQPPFVRGFTGQEQLPNGVCLTNFNARIYNPAIGRFFSADPTVEAPYNPQDLNRYSYVLNDPTLFTDPSGLCFLGCFWKSPIFDAVLDIAIFFVVPELEGYSLFGSSGLIAQAAAFNLQDISILALNGGLAGGISSAVGGGNPLTGFYMGAAQAGATFGLGGPLGSVLGPALGAAAAGTAIAQGMVGGLLSVASNSNFVSGFLAGGVGSLAGPMIGQEPAYQGLLISAVLGGASSVLGGGKFANGAVTGAFSYAATMAANSSQSTASNGGAAPDFVIQDALHIAEIVWTLPNTAIGLTVGLFDGLASYAISGELPTVNFANGAIQIAGLQIGPSGGITFGNVQLYTGYDAYGNPVGPGTTIYNSPYTDLSGFPLGVHEEAHTLQSFILGPMFIPVWVATGGYWAPSPLESQADIFASGGSAWPW